MKLPNAKHAVVPIEKLRDYSLDPTHEEGKHKARVFASALGLGVEDAEWLQSELLRGVEEYECTLGRRTEFGQRYVVDFRLTRDDKHAIVRSIWNIRPGEFAPRLVTCYVL